MQYTENYNLYKPVYGEPADVADLNHNADEIDGLIHDNRTMIAPAYDTAVSYVVGDIVEHLGKVYKCIGATTGVWDSTKWTQTTLADEIEEGAGGASALDDLTDVDLSTPTDGQALLYDGTAGKWVNATLPTPTVPDELNDLDDVNITTPTDGQILVYDDTDDEWKNADIPDPSVTAEATGNPIEITDAADAPMGKCVSAITGSQDLHGYDKPWVGGAGVNLMPPGEKKTITTNGITLSSDGEGRYSLSGSAYNSDTEFELSVNEFIVPNGSNTTIAFMNNLAPSAGSRYVRFEFYYNTIKVDSWILDPINRAKYQFVTLSGASINKYVIKIEQGVNPNGLTFSPMMVSGNVTSNLPDFAPYSNICPITAYTENTISVVGRNIYNPQYNTGASGNYFQFYGLHTAGSSYKDRGTVLQAGRTYRITVDIGTSKQFGVYGARENSSSQIEISTNSSKKHVSVAFTPTVTDKYSFWLYSSGGWSGYTTDNVTLMIENGDTEHEYEPYNPNSTTHTTTFPSAIYRGSEDVVNGEVTEITRKLTFTGDVSEGWSVNTNNNKAIFYISVPTEYRVQQNFICNEFYSRDVLPYHELNNNEIAMSLQFEFINVRHDKITTVGAWRTFLANNNLELTLTLATPTTSSVTPTNLPIKTLSGYNHIESSTGDMEVEYITKPYEPVIEATDISIEEHGKTIESIITENLEPRMVASRNYTLGELIISGNNAYRATANIASGATLTVGTNVVATTIEDEIGRSGHVYSTSEQVVGTWIDGSTLYQRIISVDNPTKQSYSTYYYYAVSDSLGSAVGYACITDFMVYDSSDGRWYAVPEERLISSENIYKDAYVSGAGSIGFTVFFSQSAQYNITKISARITYTKV